MKRLLLMFLAFVALLSQAQTDTLTLSDLVVTGTRQATDVRHLPMTVSVVGRDVLTQQEQTSVLPTVMQQVPSFMVTSRGVMGYGVSTGAAGGISLRGLSGGAGQFLVLIDGHPQYAGVFGHPISDTYQTLMAERVEVLRGPASVLYGSNAMGGVMNIVTRALPQKGVHTHLMLGGGSYGTFQAEASNLVRYGRFASTLALQYERTDNHRPNMGFEQYGGYLKLGYDFSDHWRTRADLDITHFNASNPGSVSQPKLENDQWITRWAAGLTLENHYDNTSGALSIYDNYGRHKINDGYNAEGGTPQTDLFRSRDAVAGVSAYQTAALFDGNRLTVGIDYQHIYGRAWYTDRVTGQIVTTPQRLKQSVHAHENEVAVYTDFRQDIIDCLTIDAGLRFDHHSTAGSEWIPQAGIVWRPVNDGQLKASVGKGFRNPTPRELFMYGTANSETLHAERLMNYELAWQHRVGTVSYGLDLFFIDADNIIQVVNGHNENSGKIRNYGLELEATWQAGNHWHLNTNHSLLHMRYPVVAAPTYKGFVGADCHYGKWSAVAGLQVLAGLYTAVGANETKENFVLLDASVSYALCDNLSLWLRGENLLAQRYEFNLGYPMPRATFMAGIHVKF